MNALNFNAACCKRFVDESFGTTVFTDKSQMQAKLKELNNETT